MLHRDLVTLRFDRALVWQPSGECGEQLTRLDRLGNKIVHTCIDTGIAVFFKHIGGHRQNRNRRIPGPTAYQNA